uniref:Fatty acyl-CoA reductase n=1 Tax=Angiostrongylus cantonensis TaxID=6313 RepID=A0A0K0D7Q3_ANGCA
MSWRHRLNVCREKDRSANETDPSNVITELVVAIRSAKSVDYLVHVSACILNSNLLVEDAHHIILELVIPEMVSQSENRRAAECLGYRSFGSFRSLLNLLEVVLPAIDSYTAEVMIRAVISPYRQMYMKNRDLEDSFIMLTSKCISLGHVAARESGLSDWLLTCVHKCYKRASQDIWRFMKDSVVKHNRILFCALFIIHNALEYDLGISKLGT